MGMRPGVGLPTMSKRAKRVLIAVVALVVLVFLWFQFARYYVDLLWFREVGFARVFTTQLLSRLVMFVVAAVLGGGLAFLAMMFAYRSRPVFVPAGPSNDPLAPYRTAIASRPRLISIAAAVAIGIICGLAMQGQWPTVQLFLHGGSFGQTDPQFGHDVGFYVFKLPMIELLLTSLFIITAICFVLVLAIQYIFGGIRLQGPGRRVTSAATLQLSLLVGFFVLVKAVQYWFDRYTLLFSNRGGIFTGASYTDVNAVLPAKIILMVIAVICAGGFIVGAVLRSVKLPAIALALMVLSSVLIGGLWPLILQQVVVKPSASQREPMYIQRSIEATQAAYGIGSETVTTKPYNDVVSSDPQVIRAMADDTATVPNARLLDPNLLSPTFTQREQLENFYGFPSRLAVDRYEVDGKTQDFVVAAREINPNALAENQKNWINEHMTYTHGNGFVAAPANTVVAGLPEFTVSDIDNKGTIPVDEPRVYFGQLGSDYAIVGAPAGTAPQEYDTSTKRYTYAGKAGIGVGNLFRRLVFASYYGEPNFLFSSLINDESKVLQTRQVRDRVAKAAPFLTIDTNPYPAVVNGRITFIVDAYTTAGNYPYAQQMSLADATRNSQSAQGATARQVETNVSYVRNSVKATVDAYDGTVTLYRVDQNDPDPMLDAWNRVFPGLLQPDSAVSEELRSHFRYPQDLFEVQRELLAKYHVADGTQFFNSGNFWKVPDDPTEQSVEAAQPPYYLQVSQPGEDEPRFELTTAMTGFERDLMAAYISANSDPENYGKINVLTFPTSTQTPGPKLVQQLFNQDDDISNWITTRTRGGSNRALFGNLLTLPTSQGLMYIEPFYLQANSESSYPTFSQVFVWFGGRVGMGSTLAQALSNAATKNPASVAEAENAVNSGETGAPSSGNPPSSDAAQVPSPTEATVTTPSGEITVPPADEAAAVDQMNAALAELEAAKKSQDLAKIGAANSKLEQAVQDYLRIAKPAASTTAGTSSAPAGSDAPGSGG